MRRSKCRVVWEHAVKLSSSMVLARARMLAAVLTGLCALALSGCNSKNAAPPKVTGPAAAVATTSFEGEAKVVSVAEKRSVIELDHKDIKGLMPAMTMEFNVKDKSLLEGIKAGDHVEFTVDNGVGGLEITRIRKL
jgi:Cu(I)/Ag(I) efflux system periplasmic protein CusF